MYLHTLDTADTVGTVHVLLSHGKIASKLMRQLMHTILAVKSTCPGVITYFHLL